MTKEKKMSPSAAKLIGIVSSVMKTDITKNTRVREAVEGRGIFYTIYRNLENTTLADIGALFDRDHATVLHGINSMKNFMELDPRLKAIHDKCVELYVSEATLEEEMSKQDLVCKVSELEGRISELNSYIAELKGRIVELEEHDSDLFSVLEVVRMHTPKSKIEEAKKKVRAVLNGL
jgi:hypothetical protein